MNDHLSTEEAGSKMIEVSERALLHPVERLRPPLKSLLRAIWRLIRRRPLVVFAAALIAADLGFIAIQIAVDATDYGFKGAYRLSLDTEMGVAQFYGWVQAGAAAFLLYQAWRRFNSPVAGLWAAAIAYLGVDDALRIHEELGTVFSKRFEIGEMGPLRGQDIGELIAYALILTIAVAALVVAERRVPGKFPSMVTSVMVPAVGVFLFFAVVLDTIGSVLPHVLQVAVEDGGELLGLSAIFLISVVWSHQADELAAESGASDS